MEKFFGNELILGVNEILMDVVSENIVGSIDLIGFFFNIVVVFDDFFGDSLLVLI